MAGLAVIAGHDPQSITRAHGLWVNARDDSQ